MNVLLDIAIVLILALSVVSAAKKGFFKTLLSGTAFLLAVIVTLIFVAPLRDAMLGSGLHTGIREGIRDSVHETVSSAVGHAVEDGQNTVTAIFESEKLTSVIKAVGIDPDELRQSLDLHDTAEAAITKLADDLTVGLARLAVGALAAIILLVGSYIALKLLAVLLTAVCQLPLLKQANSLLGLLLGGVLGLIRVLMFVSVIRMLLPVMQTSGSAFLSAVDPARTLLFAFFENLDLLSFLA